MDAELRDLERLVGAGDLGLVPRFARAMQRAGHSSLETAHAIYTAQLSRLGHAAALELAWSALENAGWIRLEPEARGSWWVWGRGPAPSVGWPATSSSELTGAADGPPSAALAAVRAGGWCLNAFSVDREFIERLPGASFALMPEAWDRAAMDALDALALELAPRRLAIYVWQEPDVAATTFMWVPFDRSTPVMWQAFGPGGGGVRLGRMKPEAIDRQLETMSAEGRKRGFDVDVARRPSPHHATAERLRSAAS